MTPIALCILLMLTACRLLKRRQIAGSRPCAIATTHLFLKVVAESKLKKVDDLIERIRALARRLIHAQPRELVVGNIARRVLGLIREVIEPAMKVDSGAPTPMAMTPMISLLPATEPRFPVHRLGHGTDDNSADPLSMRDIKEDVLNGLREMLDEIDQADEQIASYALEHIAPHDTIMTYTSSLTVQKFLLSAAKKRKFTVIHVEGYPNLHEETYETISKGRNKTDEESLDNDDRLKPLTAAGVNVVIVPDSAVFALMPRVNKVILPAHAIVSNGGCTALAGSRVIAQAAKAHRVPVFALGAVFKLSPIFPFEVESLIEMGDAGKVNDYRESDMVENIEAVNPTLDYVPPELTSLFISNM